MFLYSPSLLFPYSPSLVFPSSPSLLFPYSPSLVFLFSPSLLRRVVGAFVQGGQYFRARWSPYLCKVCFCVDHLARPICPSIPSGPFGAFKVCGIKAHLARLTPFPVSKWGILLTKSLSKTHSVSKWGILLTKSLPETHSVSKTADLLTEFIECAKSRCAELVGAAYHTGAAELPPNPLRPFRPLRLSLRKSPGPGRAAGAAP